MNASVWGQSAPSVNSFKREGLCSAENSTDAKPWVLVVDDDDDTRDVLRMALEDESYQVIEAANGSEALSLLCLYHAPLVVILDQRMPGLLGTDVLDEVLRSAHLSHTRAYILLTASPNRLPSPYNHRRFQRFIPVVGKPMELEDLLGAVRCACERLRGAHAIQRND